MWTGTAIAGLLICAKFEKAPSWTLSEAGLHCLDPPFLDKIGMCLSREMGLHPNRGISRIRKKGFKE